MPITHCNSSKYKWNYIMLMILSLCNSSAILHAQVGNAYADRYRIYSGNHGKVINIEGDSDHPINEGALCSKGSALYQVANNDLRLKKVKYRAPGSDHWEEKSWNWAIDRIAENIKKTRDAELSDGRKTNRINSIAALGGAALDNEECYLYSKLMRALGVVYIEHQARI